MAGNVSGASASPLKVQQLTRAIETALRGGDMATAARLSNDAVAAGGDHPNFLVLAGYHQMSLGDFEHALELAERAKDKAPRNGDVLNLLGQVLTRLNRPREAVAAYDGALRAMPGVAAIHFGRACALEDMGEVSRAARELERTLDLQPNHADALARLSVIAAQRGDAESARKHALRALTFDPRNAAAALALGMADVEERKFEQALNTVIPVARNATVTLVNRALAQGLMGDAYDGLGKPAEAFAAYRASNETQRDYFRPMIETEGNERAIARVQRLTDYFEQADPAQWKAAKGGASGKIETHVFLVGFPRSGTTLLENALASHPDVEALEERPTLADAETEFITAADGLQSLARADDGTLDRFRKAYWARVAGERGMPKSRVFVDKLPLNSVLLPLVAKLFPDAKILFALRDPRDVVWSCFRRRFEMNTQMFEFLSLTDTANYYAAVMKLCDLYRAKLGLAVQDVSYERLVGDFEGEVKKICTFLGIAWNDAMKNFTHRAKTIATPSAAQVARGLYTQGAGQWRAYEKQLQPVMPILAPWIARYGATDRE